MNNNPEIQTRELDERRLQILRGKPLRSRLRWLTIPIAYIALLISALFAVIVFMDGMWLAVGLTAVALAASVVPEMIADLRYSKYREEWEIANRDHASSGG